MRKPKYFEQVDDRGERSGLVVKKKKVKHFIDLQRPLNIKDLLNVIINLQVCNAPDLCQRHLKD